MKPIMQLAMTAPTGTPATSTLGNACTSENNKRIIYYAMDLWKVSIKNRICENKSSETRGKFYERKKKKDSKLVRGIFPS